MKEKSEVSKAHAEYEAIYAKYHKLVLSFIYDHIDKDNDFDVVADIFQAVWLKVFERIEMFSKMGENDIKNYTRAMVRNMAADYYNKMNRESGAYANYKLLFHEEIYEDNFEEIDELADSPEQYLKRAKELLSEKERTLIELFYDSKLSGRAISELLGISEANVRVRLQRARNKLRKEIEKMMENDEKGGERDE